MKRLCFLCVAALLCLALCSCTREADIYGTWYNDNNGERNALQFSENDSGESVFVWAVYDIEEDKILSNTSGHFHIDGNTLTLKYQDKSESLEVSFELSGDTLTLSSETAALTLTKFTLDG